MRSNESKMRKNARYYQFWREQHKQRVAEAALNAKKVKGCKAKTRVFCLRCARIE